MAFVEARVDSRTGPLLGRVRKCEGSLGRFRGLMLRRHLEEDEGLLLVGQRESRLDSAIHMLFVFFPIAAVWLDAEGYVVDAQLARPFRPLYVPKAPAQDVLEGTPSLLDKVCVGDRLYFSEVRDD